MDSLSPFFIENVCRFLSYRAEQECALLAYPVFEQRLYFGFRSRSAAPPPQNLPYASHFIIYNIFVRSDRGGSTVIDAGNISRFHQFLSKSLKPPNVIFSTQNHNSLLWQLLSGLPVGHIVTDLPIDRHLDFLWSTVPNCSISALLFFHVDLNQSFLRCLVTLLQMDQLRHLSLAVGNRQEDVFDVLLGAIVESLSRRPKNDRYVLQTDKRKKELLERTAKAVEKRQNLKVKFSKFYKALSFQVCFHGGKLWNAMCDSCSC
ncbi:hypothetical protein QR680_004431 [Steinernema hermaphroditum]|uniref:Uncharacterized protein n=1 Tax=Steinernema hermaphroditum TaxID=289476 RepID=A0AA39LTZ7_9BILA|nr:hypothetical protein QR680_004431 [Steinernema hermaphroditum]